MRPIAGGALLVVAGCQPGALRQPETTCFPDRPALGEIAVAEVRCEAMGLSRGEAQSGDFWLANSELRAVVRHPQASLTLVGAGGGTVIDAAPWGLPDWLHEVAPLVRGGWLDVDELEPMPDGFRLAGTVVSLPDRLAEGEGERAEVRWRIEADEPWLRFEGADGLWLHASGSFWVYDGWLWSDVLVYGHDGTLVEDLGGAVRIEGATGLFMGTPARALAELAGPRPQGVSGIAPGADRVLLERDGTVIGLIPTASDGSFAAGVPLDVDRVRGEGGGRASSYRVAPGTGLELILGDEASFELRPAWPTDRSRGLRIAWSAFDGRSGLAHLPANGGTLFLGMGDYDLTVSAGPSYREVQVAVEAFPLVVPVVGVQMVERFDPHPFALGALGWPTDRSRSWRGNDTTSAVQAAGTGAEWVVFTAHDDVAVVSDTPTAFPRVHHRNGSTTLGLDGDWRILSWPWTSTLDRPGHGAVAPLGLSPEDALAAAVGGVSRDRHTVVDLAWLEAAQTAPWAVDPRPEAVFLDHPGAAGPAAWAAWYRWLDAAIPLSPVALHTWFEVHEPALLASEDMEQALTAGRTVATTGPLLRLSSGDEAPGDLSEADPELHRLFQIELQGAQDVDHVALIGEGGAVLRQWARTGSEDQLPLFAAAAPGRWVIAAAWDDAGTSFAVTSPIWSDPP